MNQDPSATSDLVTLQSAHGAAKTVERLKAHLVQKGIQLFVHIDHAAGAKTAGLALRPTHLMILGNPQAGTPLMQSQQTIGLDLPLRVLIWEDETGKVWLTYHRPAFLAKSHNVLAHDDVVKNLEAGLAALAHAVTSP